MDRPWDTAIDGEDNVWVANFGSLQLLTPLSGQTDEALGRQCPAGSQRG